MVSAENPFELYCTCDCTKTFPRSYTTSFSIKRVFAKLTTFYISRTKQNYTKTINFFWKNIKICDGIVLEIYLDHKLQLPQEGLNCESLAYEVVT